MSKVLAIIVAKNIKNMHVNGIYCTYADIHIMESGRKIWRALNGRKEIPTKACKYIALLVVCKACEQVGKYACGETKVIIIVCGSIARICGNRLPHIYTLKCSTGIIVYMYIVKQPAIRPTCSRSWTHTHTHTYT